MALGFFVLWRHSSAVSRQLSISPQKRSWPATKLQRERPLLSNKWKWNKLSMTLHKIRNNKKVLVNSVNCQYLRACVCVSVYINIKMVTFPQSQMFNGDFLFFFFLLFVLIFINFWSCSHSFSSITSCMDFSLIQLYLCIAWLWWNTVSAVPERKRLVAHPHQNGKSENVCLRREAVQLGLSFKRGVSFPCSAFPSNPFS